MQIISFRWKREMNFSFWLKQKYAVHIHFRIYKVNLKPSTLSWGTTSMNTFSLISQNNRDVTFVKFLSPMHVDIFLQPQFSQTCIRSLFHTTLVQNGGIYHFKSPICGGGGGSQSSNHVYLLYYQSRRGKEIRIDLNFHF